MNRPFGAGKSVYDKAAVSVWIVPNIYFQESQTRCRQIHMDLREFPVQASELRGTSLIGYQVKLPELQRLNTMRPDAGVLFSG